jgi:peroxiredoxin Q/BCP
VSKDTVESHERFAKKFHLDCYLLADPDGRILAQLGIQKEPGGRARRTTFVVDKTGILRIVFENVSVRGHADAVLAAVKAL